MCQRYQDMYSKLKNMDMNVSVMIATPVAHISKMLLPNAKFLGILEAMYKKSSHVDQWLMWMVSFISRARDPPFRLFQLHN